MAPRILGDMSAFCHFFWHVLASLITVVIFGEACTETETFLFQVENRTVFLCSYCEHGFFGRAKKIKFILSLNKGVNGSFGKTAFYCLFFPMTKVVVFLVLF
jgi:hypothetical protein